MTAELSIDQLDELDGQAVAVVEGSTFAVFVEAQGVRVVGFESQAAAFDAVAAGELDVVVVNPFALATAGDEHGVRSAGELLFEEFETFGLQAGSVWREPINMALADMQATGRVQRIIDRWTTG